MVSGHVRDVWAPRTAGEPERRECHSPVERRAPGRPIREGEGEMRRYLAYLSYVIRHRWWVMLECWRIGLIWRGLVHDLSKFFPSEFRAYAWHFYNADGSKREKPPVSDAYFDRAWLFHQARNRHHWQWWVLPLDDGSVYAHAMGKADWREMVCDWHGAARAKGVRSSEGDRLGVWAWWWKNRRVKIHLHLYTEMSVDIYLADRKGRKA